MLSAIENSQRRIETLISSSLANQQRTINAIHDGHVTDSTADIWIDEDEIMNQRPPNASNDVVREYNRVRQDEIRLATRKRKLKIGIVRDKLQVLPANFNFPSMNCFQLVQNWFFGCVTDNIPPYYYLDQDRKYLKHIKNGGANIRMMAAVMGVIEGIARSQNCWKEKLKDWGVASVTSMWSVVSPILYFRYLGSNPSRPVELAWKTLYNRMSKKKAFIESVTESDVTGGVSGADED